MVTPDGSARRVADSLAFPNGMAVTADNATLICAESYGKKLTSFDIASDGSLSDGRVWADLGDGVSDGICVDAEGAVWYGDVPNMRCVRVREGGDLLQTIELDRGCFACMLGGRDDSTLFMVAQDWRGAERMRDGARTGQVLTIPAPAAGAGWPEDAPAALCSAWNASAVGTYAPAGSRAHPRARSADWAHEANSRSMFANSR